MKSFFRNSLAGYIIEVKSINDALIYTKYWTLIWAAIFKLILKLLFKKGPIVLIRQLIHYPWMFISSGRPVCSGGSAEGEKVLTSSPRA